MANFNPDVPRQNDPVYFHYSRPIEKPEFRVGQPAPTATPISSFGEALSTAGEVAGITVRGADEAVKNFANQETQDKVRALRDQYAGQLTDTKESLTGTKGQTPVPSGIRDLGGKIDGLINAKDSGKISPTYYYGQAMKLASEVRSHYPVGYREYIDDKFKDVLGVDPANAYIRSVTADINDAVGKGQEEMNHVMTQLRAMNLQGIPGADRMIAQLRNSGNVDTAQSWINKTQYRKYYTETLKEDVENAKNTQELGLLAGEKYVKQDLSNKVTQFYEQVYGDGPNQVNPNNLADLKNASPEEIDAHVQKIAQAKNNLERQARLEFNTPSIPIKDQNGKVIGMKRMADVMPQETFNAHLAAAGQQFDNDIAMIRSKDFGAAYATDRINQTAAHNAEWSLNKSPLGPPAMIMKALRDKMGENFFSGVMMQTLDKKYDLTGKMSDYMTLQMSHNYVSSKPASLQAQIQQAKTDIGTSAKYNDGLIDRYRTMLDGAVSTDPAKKEAARISADILFGSDNMKFIDSVTPDYYDEQGNFHPGAEAVWRKMTDPKVGEAVRALGPEQFKQWQSWSEGNYRNLFMRDLKNLDQLQNSDSLSVRWYADESKFKLRVKGTDQDVDSLSEKVPMANGVPIVPRNTLRDAKRAVNTINSSLSNLSNIAKSANYDVNSYLWQTLTDMGVNPKGMDLPARVLKAIEAAHPKKETNKEFFKQ